MLLFRLLKEYRYRWYSTTTKRQKKKLFALRFYSAKFHYFLFSAFPWAKKDIVQCMCYTPPKGCYSPKIMVAHFSVWCEDIQQNNSKCHIIFSFMSARGHSGCPLEPMAVPFQPFEQWMNVCSRAACQLFGERYEWTWYNVIAMSELMRWGMSYWV